ncbi:MAG: methionyl-tRNA formyltransferase [Flavobacteriales bacterium]|nr:methionyl-tRNA formyltransferase [Flavobacteriales bacterium]
MKIIFFGTPPFSAYILEKLQSSYNVVGVVCPPDREKGRGRKIISPAVKQKAEELNIEVFQPTNLKDIAFINSLENLNADLFIVVAFRMLPSIIWKIPKKGCVNLHTSLLPNYRGAAPINWVLINGEEQTGITTFFINDKIDQGDILLQETIELDGKFTAASLHNVMMEKGADLLLETVKNIEKGTVKEIEQSISISDKIAPKLNKSLFKIDWNKQGRGIHNLIRGLSPCLSNNTLLKDVAICPSAWFYLIVENQKQIRVKLLLSNFELGTNSLEVGSIVTDNKTHLKIAVKDGFISILKLQLEGKKAMDVKSFLAGFQMKNNFRVC